MHRRRMPAALIGVMTALVIVGALVLNPATASAQSAGGCQLQGQASFNPGLGSSSQSFDYSFTGSLTGCQATVSAPTTGTVSAGEVIAETTTVSTSSGPVTATFNYQEPAATGTGGCSSSTTSGDAFTVWSDGTQTAIAYTTTGAAAAVTLQGQVVSDVILQPVAGQGVTVGGVFYPAPTYDWATTRFAGDTAGGPLTFQPPDPTACTTATGVTAAAISGAVSLYSS